MCHMRAQWSEVYTILSQETTSFYSVLEFCFLSRIYLLSLLSFLFESSLFILLSLLALLLPRMLSASRTLRGVAATEEELGAATLLEPEKGIMDRHYRIQYLAWILNASPYLQIVRFLLVFHLTQPSRQLRLQWNRNWIHCLAFKLISRPLNLLTFISFSLQTNIFT